MTKANVAWLSAIGALLVFELLAVALGWQVLTASYRENAVRWSVIPIGVGVMVGHLHGMVFGGILGPPSWMLFPVVLVMALGRDLIIGTRFEFAMVYPLCLFGQAVGMLSWVGRP